MAETSVDRAARYQRYREADIDRVRKQSKESQQRYRDRLRDAVVAAYGGQCTCCGESEPMFLTVDHVNGLQGGPRLWSTRLYRLVRDEGFPAKYTILCFNCNSGRARNGGVCPHE